MNDAICEVCGKKAGRLYSVIIEGSQMLVCNECASLGKKVSQKPSKKIRFITKDEEKEESLVENYGEIIKNKILEKYKDLKEFCKKHNYKESYLKKVIEGELPLSIDEAKKLEKILKIKLVVLENKEDYEMKEKELPKLTLGDLIKEKLNL